MTRDYQAWHDGYDDPESGLPWRLQKVQSYITEQLDNRPGHLRVLSACAGDGRDILGVLAARADADRVDVTLVELHPSLAAAARATAAAAGLGNVQVRTADAGNTSAYIGAVPADLVLMVGIFGNISDVDLERTVRAMPQLCAPGATLVWSRAPRGDDRNDAVRAWFAESDFVEIDYAVADVPDPPALGVARFDGPPAMLVPDRHLFTFVR